MSVTRVAQRFDDGAARGSAGRVTANSGESNTLILSGGWPLIGKLLTGLSHWLIGLAQRQNSGGQYEGNADALCERGSGRSPSDRLAAQAQDKTIKIGALFPMSGPGSYFGAQDKQGVKLALEQLNKAGVNGYKFVVQYEDSSCSPLPATQAAKRLIEQFKPDVIIGEECSDATLAVMPVVEQAKVPLLNAGSSSIKVTEPGNPWTFRIMPNEVMQGINLAENASKRMKAETAVLLFENTNAGIGNAQVFKENFTSSAARSSGIGFGRDVNDFTAIATRGGPRQNRRHSDLYA
jgi:ABC-type branched-subunit amino acid transport system substrate-binding protein